MTRAMRIDIADDVTPELVTGFERLGPQLSSSNPPPTREQLAAIVASPATDLIVAYDDDDGLVGSLTLVVFQIPTGVRAWIEDVVVDESARGQGVGTALNRAALDRARALGRDHGRPHVASLTGRSQPALPAARLRAEGDQRVPVRPEALARM